MLYTCADDHPMQNAVQSEINMLVYAQTWLKTKATGTHMHHGTDLASELHGILRCKLQDMTNEDSNQASAAVVQPCSLGSPV